MVPKHVKLLSFITVIVIYSTMLVGTYVSKIGAGLACPDWPLCPEITSFGILVEFLHRGFAMLSFILAVTTSLVLRSRREEELKPAKKLALAGLVAITVQVFFVGAQVIFSLLHPLLVTTHMGVALLVFGFYLGTALYLIQLK
ncbi:MAG: hypothetical protein NXY59_04515 [Aigarchaeota archaeon]|nr:hypothetical protein [Candidatus Pelearchaeum maunauluense]